MPRWFPAKPGSGCCVSLPWDHGPAPHRGSWPHSQSGRGWALVQVQPAGSRAEAVGRAEGQPLLSAQTFPSSPALRLTTLRQDAVQHGPLAASAPSGSSHTRIPCPSLSSPHGLLCLKHNAIPTPCPMVQAGQPDSHGVGQYRHHWCSPCIPSTSWCSSG